MEEKEKHAITILQAAMEQFSKLNPHCIQVFVQGQRFINQGDSSNKFYLIQEGTLRVFKVDPKGVEEHVDYRYPGTIIGETAILHRNEPRGASVEVVSEQAVVIGLNRNEIFSLFHKEPLLEKVMPELRKLWHKRSHETSQLLNGKIEVDHYPVSVLLGDIHGFSALGEDIFEEYLNAFLFDLIEKSEEISDYYLGSFTEQGDGFRIFFKDIEHETRAVNCALELKKLFLQLREIWVDYDNSFEKIGLGIGVCTDHMSIRRRVKPSAKENERKNERILSHSISVAAAISKYRDSSSDVQVWVDENTKSALPTHKYEISKSDKKPLEKLAAKYTLYEIKSTPITPNTQVKEFLNNDGFMTPSQHSSTICDALLDGYRTKLQLEIMVKHHLNQNLNQIAEGENMLHLVFNLVEWAERKGMVKQLIKSALADNPYNSKLMKLMKLYE